MGVPRGGGARKKGQWEGRIKRGERGGARERESVREGVR